MERKLGTPKKKNVACKRLMVEFRNGGRWGGMRGDV